MSLAAIYLFFERTFAIAKAEKVSPDFMNKIRDYIGQGSFDSARNLCQSSNTPMARMLDKGISRIGKDLKDISVSIENIGKLEIYNLEKNLSSLATIASAAPMLGFLGTVLGMVQVFLDMEQVGTVSVSTFHRDQTSHDHDHRGTGGGHHCLHGLQQLGEQGLQSHS